MLCCMTLYAVYALKRKLLYNLNKRLFENNISIFDIQRFLNEQWDKNKDN
jgi:hypothetical protein